MALSSLVGSLIRLAVALCFTKDGSCSLLARRSPHRWISSIRICLNLARIQPAFIKVMLLSLIDVLFILLILTSFEAFRSLSCSLLSFIIRLNRFTRLTFALTIKLEHFEDRNFLQSFPSQDFLHCKLPYCLTYKRIGYKK